MFKRFMGLLISIFFITPVYGHEFWISPLAYNLNISQPILAHFRIGQEFNGSPQSFLRHRTVRHEIHHGGDTLKVNSRNGDRPAIQTNGLEDGLAVLVHETSDSILKYNEFEKFVNFVKHKKFDGVLDAHSARNLPKTRFSESYRRYVKSLIAIGSGVGQDKAIGLDIEIVALNNPYTDDLSDGMRIQVLMSGIPRADVQVEIFERAIGSNQDVNIKLTATDENGIAIFHAKSAHEYMIDNVALIPLEAKNGNDPVWHSLWANLTFAVK